jgi:hypothetical protein
MGNDGLDFVHRVMRERDEAEAMLDEVCEVLGKLADHHERVHSAGCEWPDRVRAMTARLAQWHKTVEATDDART